VLCGIPWPCRCCGILIAQHSAGRLPDVPALALAAVGWPRPAVARLPLDRSRPYCCDLWPHRGQPDRVRLVGTSPCAQRWITCGSMSTSESPKLAQSWAWRVLSALSIEHRSTCCGPFRGDPDPCFWCSSSLTWHIAGLRVVAARDVVLGRMSLQWCAASLAAGAALLGLARLACPAGLDSLMGWLAYRSLPWRWPFWPWRRPPGPVACSPLFWPMASRLPTHRLVLFPRSSKGSPRRGVPLLQSKVGIGSRLWERA